MRNLSRFGAVLAFPTFLFITAREAKAQFVVSDPPVEVQTLAMHVEQVAMHLEQLQQYLQEAQTALNTYQHLQLFIREVKQLASHPSTNIAGDLATFSSVLAQAGVLGLDVGQIDATWKNDFAPYSPLSNYPAAYNEWATSALKAIHSAANSSGYQGDMLQSEMGFMSQMQALNSADNGMDQSIQVGNSIGLETVAQLEKLRMLMAADLQQQAVFTTTILNAQQAGIMNQTAALTNLGDSADQRGW